MDGIVFRRSKTQRLLDLDTLASNDWSATKQMLFWWTRQGTREGVEWAWKILNRLVVDLSNNMNENGAETQIRAKILTDWLNFTVNSWRLLTIHTQSETTRTTTTNEPPLMTVGQVLRNLDTFDPHIVPDIQTYAMIIDAKIGQDPSEAAPFAEQVLERMHQESSTNHLVQPGLIAYSSVINAWSKSRLSHAGEKAEALLQRMEELGLQSNTISLDAEKSAWAGKQ
jgi:hypothetical protein